MYTNNWTSVWTQSSEIEKKKQYFNLLPESSLSDFWDSSSNDHDAEAFSKTHLQEARYLQPPVEEKMNDFVDDENEKIKIKEILDERMNEMAKEINREKSGIVLKSINEEKAMTEIPDEFLEFETFPLAKKKKEREIHNTGRDDNRSEISSLINKMKKYKSTKLINSRDENKLRHLEKSLVKNNNKHEDRGVSSYEIDREAIQNDINRRSRDKRRVRDYMRSEASNKQKEFLNRMKTDNFIMGSRKVRENISLIPSAREVENSVLSEKNVRIHRSIGVASSRIQRPPVDAEDLESHYQFSECGSAYTNDQI